jgi:hypothetical protein
VAYARALYPGAGERCGFSRNEPYANRPQNAAQVLRMCVAVGKLPVVRADDSCTELNPRKVPSFQLADLAVPSLIMAAWSEGFSGRQTAGRPTSSAIMVPSI